MGQQAAKSVGIREQLTQGMPGNQFADKVYSFVVSLLQPSNPCYDRFLPVFAPSAEGSQVSKITTLPLLSCGSSPHKSKFGRQPRTGCRSDTNLTFHGETFLEKSIFATFSIGGTTALALALVLRDCCDVEETKFIRQRFVCRHCVRQLQIV